MHEAQLEEMEQKERIILIIKRIRIEDDDDDEDEEVEWNNVESTKFNLPSIDHENEINMKKKTFSCMYSNTIN